MRLFKHQWALHAHGVSCLKFGGRFFTLATLTLVFLAVRRCSHCTSASNRDSKAWKFSHTECKSYACALRYVELYYSNSRLHKCRTHNYVSNSAENGPAIAGPAGPVLTPLVYTVWIAAPYKYWEFVYLYRFWKLYWKKQLVCQTDIMLGSHIQRASLIAGLKYEIEQWNGKWNRMVNVHSCCYLCNWCCSV